MGLTHVSGCLKTEIHIITIKGFFAHKSLGLIVLKSVFMIFCF